MSVPNLFHVVQQAFDAFVVKVGPLDSHQRCGEFGEYAVLKLHAVDPNVGHLKKNQGQTQFNGHAVDAALYKATGQAIDLITASKVASPFQPAQPSWSVEAEARYTDRDWIAPAALPPGDEEGDVNDAPPNAEPIPTPAQPPPDIRDLIAGLRLELAGQYASIQDSLDRLEADNRKPRTITGSAGWIGRIEGEIGGVRD